MAMAILALPLVMSVLKPHTQRLSLLPASNFIPILHYKLPRSHRHLCRAATSAISTSSIQQHTSTDHLSGACELALYGYKDSTVLGWELFPKVVEAYSRPTRIVRGKDVDSDKEVDDASFETSEERALWSAFLSFKNKIHPGIEVDDFIEMSSALVQPLENFSDNVFVTAAEGD